MDGPVPMPMVVSPLLALVHCPSPRVPSVRKREALFILAGRLDFY